MIGLDATALVCRLQRPQDGEFPFITEGRRRMSLLVRRADSQDERLLIPAPALAEFLVELPTGEQAEAAATMMSKLFRVIPVDGLAAHRTAQLWRQLAGMCAIRRLCDEIGYTRQMFKIDLQVIGCCLSRGARMLITGDRGVREVCRRIDLPCHYAWEIPESELVVAAPGQRQRTMFDNVVEEEEDRDSDEDE